MIKSVLTYLTLLVPAIMIAQPTITSNSVAQIGSELATEIAETAPDPGPSGADVDWDFTGVVQEDSSITVPFVYVPADTTQFFGSFPEATVCLYGAGIGSYMYYRKTADVFESLGNAFGTFKLQYSDPVTLMEFPFTFGSNATDDYANSTQVAGVSIVAWGTVDITGDAYGTLHLPDDTFNDVLRIKTVNMHVDTANFGFGTIEKNFSTITSYVWVNAEHGDALASHVTTERTQVGILNTGDTIIVDTMVFAPVSTFSYDPTAISASTRNLDLIFGSVSPNPVTENVRLIFDLPSPELLNLRVLSVDGKVLVQETVAGIPGTNAHPVDLEDFPPGTYILHLRGERSYLTMPIIRQE